MFIAPTFCCESYVKLKGMRWSELSIPTLRDEPSEGAQQAVYA